MTMTLPAVVTAGRPAPGIRIIADRTTTSGQFGLWDGRLEPGDSGPPRHVHDTCDEALLVITGSVRLDLDGEVHTLTQGGYALIPRGTPHTFRPASSTPAHLVGVSVPAGIEDLLREQQDYLRGAGGRADPARIARIGMAHSSHVVGPALDAAETCEVPS